MQITSLGVSLHEMSNHFCGVEVGVGGGGDGGYAGMGNKKNVISLSSAKSFNYLRILHR